MEKLRKIISLLLVFVLVVSFHISVNAKSVTNEDLSLQEVVSKIQSQYENAEITIDDGVINVYVDNSMGNATPIVADDGISVMATETKIYAPDGGLWNNFKRPWYTYINPDAHTLPYSVVFLPKEKANALYYARTVPGLWDFVLGNPVAESSLESLAETLAATILAKFNITLESKAVIFLFSSAMLYLYDTVNTKMLADASQNGTKKVRIDYTTIAGWPTNYYYTWTTNYVTDSPWEDFSPVFHRGIYSSADL
mgnify:CR=1 FL=1